MDGPQEESRVLPPRNSPSSSAFASTEIVGFSSSSSNGRLDMAVSDLFLLLTLLCFFHVIFIFFSVSFVFSLCVRSSFMGYCLLLPIARHWIWTNEQPTFTRTGPHWGPTNILNPYHPFITFIWIWKLDDGLSHKFSFFFFVFFILVVVYCDRGF